MKKIFIFVLCAAMALSGCSLQPRLIRYDTQFFGLFDTVTSVVGYAKDKNTFTEYMQLLYEELEEYHQLYDIYNDYEGINNIKTINDNAGGQPVVVDEKIIDMLEEAVRLYELTDGKVNVAMGSVLSIWHDYRDSGSLDPVNAKLPLMEELQEAAEHTDISKLQIDREASTVYLEDPKMSLDVGAIGKGYATEMACRSLEEAGLTSALISVGGNTRAIGVKDGGDLWAVGIQNPDLGHEEKYLHRVGLNGKSMVTSGTYQRFYTVDGVQYHHIIHPDTLMPWNEYVSVTIICPDSGLADALATAVFNMELDEGMKLIESLDGIEAMWIESDGTEHCSSGFQSYLLGK